MRSQAAQNELALFPRLALECRASSESNTAEPNEEHDQPAQVEPPRHPIDRHRLVSDTSIGQKDHPSAVTTRQGAEIGRERDGEGERGIWSTHTCVITEKSAPATLCSWGRAHLAMNSVPLENTKSAPNTMIIALGNPYDQYDWPSLTSAKNMFPNAVRRVPTPVHVGRQCRLSLKGGWKPAAHRLGIRQGPFLPTRRLRRCTRCPSRS